MPPPLSGSGANLVHRTTLEASGSPEATPRLKGSPDSSIGGSVDVVVDVELVVAGSDVVDVDDVGTAVPDEDESGTLVLPSEVSEHAARTTAAPAAKNVRREMGCIYAVCLNHRIY
jgi:hypothetical protein